MATPPDDVTKEAREEHSGEVSTVCGCIGSEALPKPEEEEDDDFSADDIDNEVVFEAKARSRRGARANFELVMIRSFSMMKARGAS